MLIDDDALLDPDRRQLILDGTGTDLTKLEFNVLQYLYEREGRVVGRAELLRDVWGYDWSGRPATSSRVVISALPPQSSVDSAGNPAKRCAAPATASNRPALTPGQAAPLPEDRLTP